MHISGINGMSLIRLPNSCVFIDPVMLNAACILASFKCLSYLVPEYFQPRIIWLPATVTQPPAVSRSNG